MLKAGDIMTTDVAAVPGDARISIVARLMAERGVSAVPVIEEGGKLIGIISEGDLIHRKEIQTPKKRRSWWLDLLSGEDQAARDYTKAHAMTVRDLMVTPVISVTEDTLLSEIADILDAHRIKRVPVTRRGALIGIVSRADLVKALVRQEIPSDARQDDKSIRNSLFQRLKTQTWAPTSGFSFTVSDGIIELHGLIDSHDQKQAIRVMAEAIPGVKGVRDNLYIRPTTLID